ncbi:MAG: hypothetical protein HQK51_21995 [Oligoflexia bacterium]|nr:hypothetical protein [Oligoflexia bacterium]
MKKIILIEQDNILEALYSLNLSTFLGATVIVKKTTIEVIELLQANIDTTTATTNIDTIQSESNFVLIITRNLYANSTISAENLYSFLYKSNLKIPMIVLGSKPPLFFEGMTIVDEKIDVFDLVKQAATIIGVTNKRHFEHKRSRLYSNSHSIFSYTRFSYLPSILATKNFLGRSLHQKISCF